MNIHLFSTGNRLIPLLIMILMFFRNTGAESQSIETAVQTGHYASVEAMASSPDGRFIATGSVNKSIILWRRSVVE